MMRKYLLPIICLCIAATAYMAYARMQMMSLTVVVTPPSLYTDYTQDASCVGAWYMNNNGGTEQDRTPASDEDLYDVGSPPTSSSDPYSGVGVSRDFDEGTPDYLYHADGGDTDLEGHQDFTIAAWVNMASDTGVSQYIVSKWDNDGDKRQYALIYYDSKAAFGCLISADGLTGYGEALGSTDHDLGNWQHIACVHDAGANTITLYVDGEIDDGVGSDNPVSHSGGIASSKGEQFRIGAEGSTEKGFDGKIDEPIMFSRTLNITEIREIYNQGIDGEQGAND